MNAFCVETLTMPPQLRAEHGVLRAPALQVSTDAQRAANQLLNDSRRQAAALTAAAHAAASFAVREEQERTAATADALLRTLKQSRVLLLERAEDVVLELATQLFERLLLEIGPRERLVAMLRRVRQEAPSRLVSAVLRVHPDDAALISDGDGDCEWEVKPDPTLAPGTCKLEAASGEWQSGFELAREALLAALFQLRPGPATTPTAAGNEAPALAPAAPPAAG